MSKILDYFPKAKFLQTYAKTSIYDQDNLKPITPVNITEYSDLAIYVLYQISDNFEYLLLNYKYSYCFMYFQDYNAVDLDNFYIPWTTLHKDYFHNNNDNVFNFLSYLFREDKLDKLKFFEEIKLNLELYKTLSNSQIDSYRHMPYLPNLAQYLPNFLGLDWKKLPDHYDSWKAYLNETDSLSIHLYSTPPMYFEFGTDNDYIIFNAVTYYAKDNIEEKLFISNFNGWLVDLLFNLPFESLKRLISATYNL